MMKTLIILFLFIGSTTMAAQEGSTYILAGQLYDSEQNTIVKNRVIQVVKNEIVSVGKTIKIPEGAKVIDLSAYTVLPGLIDSHTHVLFSQKASEDFAEKSIQSIIMESDGQRVLRGAKRARSYLDVGVTSIKDLGNSGTFLDVALRNAINEGTVDGPRIFASGPILAASGGQIYGVSSNKQSVIDAEYRIVKSAPDAANAVREHVNQGVDLIKICADNLPNITTLSIDEIKAIVTMAHTYGLTVTAHSVTNQSAWNAILGGVDGIEHGFNLVDSTLTLMAKKGIFLVPTENSRNYMGTYARLIGEEEPKWIGTYIKKNQERLSKARALGVPIVSGSDNYTEIGVGRGKSSKDMLSAYFESGMSPLDILRSTTYLSAYYLKRENEIGVLKAKSKADIIAVKGNVMEDFIRTMENVVFVMKDGKIYVGEGLESRQ